MSTETATGSTFNIGFKTVSAFVKAQNPLEWYKAKLSADLFKGQEAEVFNWTADHLQKYRALPQVDTLFAKFPELKGIDVPEPVKYYSDLLERRFRYDTINNANLASQQILLSDKTAVDAAEEVVHRALERIKQQQYRSRIMDIGKEGGKLVLTQYHQQSLTEALAEFGWPYMDNMAGGLLPGDVISIVGRPAAGKTWLTLYVALKNWLKGRTVLFVSMEMSPLAIAQRLSSMYAGTPISYLKMATFSTAYLAMFTEAMLKMAKQPGKLYVVDGNLAASPSDVYLLADQLHADMVVVDGAYLMRHENSRLDRFQRVTANVEAMKYQSSELGLATFASWQLNRDAAKKAKQTGPKKEAPDLEDIALSDAIGQISSVVLALMQAEGVETMYRRYVDVLKGRNGEVGGYPINWEFTKMNFDQITEENHNMNPAWM